jgi:hypothetical protein
MYSMQTQCSACVRFVAVETSVGPPAFTCKLLRLETAFGVLAVFGTTVLNAKTPVILSLFSMSRSENNGLIGGAAIFVVVILIIAMLCSQAES